MSRDLTGASSDWLIFLMVELDGPRAKFQWAVQHLKLLDDECRAVLEAKPFSVVPEFDHESGCHVMRFRVRDDLFSKKLGLRVGDAVHNARSALDQAVWLIACRSNPIDMLWEPSIARKISFPVLRDEERFPRHRLMPFITDDAKTVLDSLQPYKGGDMGKAMDDLDALWNIDKHRVIHQSVAQLDISHIGFRPGSVFPKKHLFETRPETTWFPLEGSLKNGTKIAAIRFADGAGPPETDVYVNGEPKAQIAFGGGFFALSVDVIGGLLVQVDQALSRIEALSEEAPRSRASTEKG
jgi:hypothetical protein